MVNNLPTPRNIAFNPLYHRYQGKQEHSSEPLLPSLGDSIRSFSKDVKRDIQQKPLGKKLSFKENKAKYEPIARKFATQHGIDPDLFAAQIQQESGWNPTAGSSAGAQGIAQIIPSTAKGWGVQNVWDPEEALNAAAKNMSTYIKTYQKNKGLNPNGDYLTAHKLALAAYNAGPGAVQKYKGVPRYKETQDYVTRISKAFKGQTPKTTSAQSPLQLDGMSNKLSLNSTGKKLDLSMYGQSNQTQVPQRQNPLPSGQRSLNAVDQLGNVERDLMGMNTGKTKNMSGSMYQPQRPSRDPDLLGVGANNNYNNKMSRLESTLTGSPAGSPSSPVGNTAGNPSTYASSYIDAEDKSETQNNLFNNAIQSIQNTWGTPSKFNMQAFNSKKFRPSRLETSTEYA
jgi:hypothetical protein